MIILDTHSWIWWTLDDLIHLRPAQLAAIQAREAHSPSFRLPQPSFRRKPESMLAGSTTLGGVVILPFCAKWTPSASYYGLYLHNLRGARPLESHKRGWSI